MVDSGFPNRRLQRNVLTLVLSAWTACIVAVPTAPLAAQTRAKNADAAKTAKTPADPAPIPVSWNKKLATYLPTAAEVLTPPDGFPSGIALARVAPVVEFGILPGQFQPVKLWSNWGDAAFLNGNFYASTGDHVAPYGTSYVYKVDPRQKAMELVVDFNKAANLTDRSKYAPGKIHCPIMDGGDGWLYFFGYRGGAPKAEWGYVGDPLLRYNANVGVTENLGPVIPHNSVACSVIHTPSRTIYVLGASAETMPNRRDQFYAWNIDERKMIFAGGPEPLIARAMLAAADGRVYYSAARPGTGREADKSKKGDKGEPPVSVLAKYDPKSNKATLTDIRLPGDGVLRAASRPSSQGIIYGFSKDGVIFSFDTMTEQVKEITEATFAGPGYTAVTKLDATDRYLYYIPSAHGNSRQHGSAVFQLDTKTGQRKILAFLNEYIRKQLNYNLGGTFGIALNDDGSQLFICWNGRPVGGKDDNFGQCSVMVVHIPEAERAE